MTVHIIRITELASHKGDKSDARAFLLLPLFGKQIGYLLWIWTTQTVCLNQSSVEEVIPFDHNRFRVSYFIQI
jgi:hypothetical protein